MTPDPERDPATAFVIEDICFIDFETRSDTSIEAGTYRYATEAEAIVCAYAIGAGPVNVVPVTHFDEVFGWPAMPQELRDHHARVTAGEAVWAMWNAGFDKAVWNYSTLNFPDLRATHVIDVMAQAVASGLPPDLAMASAAIGRAVKLEAGKDLIKLFCLPAGLKGVRGTPQSHPAEWGTFLDYAAGDVEAMRDVWKATRRLPLAEWREYWAMEAINERGVGIDLRLATMAAALAEEDKVRSRAKLAQLTDGEVTTVDQVAKMVAWLIPRLPAEGQDILTKRTEETNDDGVVTKPAKFQLTRRRIERLLAYLENIETHEYEKFEVEVGARFYLSDLIRVLQIRQYGGSKTPAKFAKMIGSHVDEVLLGQYVFNGAAQTGRASSRGVQIHNLARDTLPDEPDVIEAVMRGATYDELDPRGDTPVSRQLSLLIRPTFVPRDNNNVFVWSDWSQIEARIVPWLCDHTAGARARVQIFRDVDADPSLPDLYTRTAAELSHVPIEQVTKPMRQRGKVAELALGFCGGVNALQAMGAGYGLHFSDDEARAVVDSWRAANPWAIDYSREIWEAMKWCIKPGNASKPAPAGRVWLRFEPRYLGGSLLARLPSGRVLTYRAMHWQDVDVLDDDDDKPTGIKTLEMMFSRGYGRTKLWPGIFIENFTQAAAADVLRGTLMRLENTVWFPPKPRPPMSLRTRLHTHDEVLVECAEGVADEVKEMLRSTMRKGFDWSDGLPLMSEETAAYYYTKHPESCEL